ncbi:50S ribosomal protein L22 [Candidatus Roizmanbacteria bacterium CG_4_10_14_0_8_um_filter_39_9]|uniref:50S ribosomal protein L22 n=1 Tax=Candidatus Roizmanbacteria bacterium CG_4_10_14_0_8_um_filter_39_9 TaxID=1974829 RepID=A0A2M7QCY5_9BACT|nr:MAG: 50S ribosomal protein L22 [Candidatus Roizmanbacteria bacterium CG_4_10_14_0_8_um_filter_39_9]
MEFTAYFHNIHSSPKKLRTVIADIKKLTPVEALDRLLYSPKKTAQIFYKAIKSVIDNAKYTLKANADMLQFKTLVVEQGQVLKRYQAGGRGTVKPYKKRFSHIKIVLKSAEVVKPMIKKSSEGKKLQIDQSAKKVKKTVTKSVTPQAK